MNKWIKCSIAVGICALSAVLLTGLAHVLEQGKHPLLSSLTCIETGDPRDLYWKINQIELTGEFNPEEGKVWIALRNNIPNFKCYFFRIDSCGQWQENTDGQIKLAISGGSREVDVRATNTLGGEIPPVHYIVSVQQGAISVEPPGGKIERGNYSFRFERAESPQIEWLKAHTLPVIADCSSQWEAFIRLRRWVREQIPNRTPVMESRWDAQRILQAVWSDTSVGFICDAYAATYVSACVSVGLNARMIHLGDSEGRGHYATEVWSDDYEKWVFMDPLYDCHFSLQGQPLSTLELRQLWKNRRLGKVVRIGTVVRQFRDVGQSDAYNSLFQDIQLINANDFLTTPLASALDLLTLRIRFIRYVDDLNPPYDRVHLICQLMVFYYLPLVITGVIVPVVIPLCAVLLGIVLLRKNSSLPQLL